MPPRTDLLQGSLDLLILKSLRLEAMHGWAIAKRIGTLSGDVLEVNQGSLYPALYRLEARGWIDATWDHSPEGRKIKVYRLTADGRKQLTVEQKQWRAFANAVAQVLDAS